MTGMERAIEQAARAVHAGHCCPCDSRGCDEPDSVDYNAARTLAEAGLLAPAPLREEWGSEMRDARPGGDPLVLRARDRDNARWQIDNNPDWATGRIMHRFVTDWETP